MTAVGEATARERKFAMRAAVTYNLPCDVRVEVRGYPVHMKSRFFSLQPDAAGPRVLLEAPVQRGIIVPLRPKDTIEVFFRVDQTRYTYHSVVLDRTEFALRNGEKVRALQTAYPYRMTRGQRREYFRIRVTEDAPVNLTVGLMASGDHGGPAGKGPAFTRRTDIVNLSAGGLAFDLREQLSRGIRMNDRLVCDLRLPNGEPVSLWGRVAATYHIRGHGIVRYGVEFTGQEQALDDRVAQDQILRYVVDVQREELARRSGLSD